jgi:hypothetical protein
VTEPAGELVENFEQFVCVRGCGGELVENFEQFVYVRGCGGELAENFEQFVCVRGCGGKLAENFEQFRVIQGNAHVDFTANGLREQKLIRALFSVTIELGVH